MLKSTWKVHCRSSSKLVCDGHSCESVHLERRCKADILQALVLMATIVGFSSAWIRAKYYEVFLMTHIILSIVILYSLFAYGVSPVVFNSMTDQIPDTRPTSSRKSLMDTHGLL